MLAGLFKATNDLVVEEYQIQSLRQEDLLVKVHTCGVCGTDHHIYNGKAPSSPPVILGHEYSGIVTDISGKVKLFSVGDKVVIDPNIFCSYCNYCKRGKVQFCENHKALGVNINGGFAEYSIVPQAQAYLLPRDFDLSLERI